MCLVQVRSWTSDYQKTNSTMSGATRVITLYLSNMTFKRLSHFALDVSLKPKIDQGSIKLLHHETWTVIDT